MDYFKNEDYFICQNGFGFNGQPTSAVQGVKYTVLADLAQEPVTLDDFKLHCRVDFNTDDALLAFYLKSAREYLEAWSQLSFGVKTIRFSALKVPDKWRLVNGPYTAVTTPGYTLFDDHLMQGGTEIVVELTTGWPGNLLPEAIKVAICLEAATQYMVREGVIMNVNGSIQTPEDAHDRALKLLKPFANITFP